MMQTDDDFVNLFYDLVTLFYDLVPHLDTLVRLNRMNEIAPHPSSGGGALFSALGAIERLLQQMDER